MAALLVLLGLVLLPASAAAQILPGWLHKEQSDFRTFGRITSFELNAPLHTPKPLTSLADFPAKNFTYALYPTAGSGAGGMVPGDTVTGAPLLITVARGLWDHHLDADRPMEFQVIKTELAQLPKAPGKQGLLVYSVLYTGADLANCTGVVDLLELHGSRLLLASQFSYDCQGGAGATWDQDKRQHTLQAARYTPGDKPCCPTVYDHVVFKLDGKHINTGEIRLGNDY